MQYVLYVICRLTAVLIDVLLLAMMLRVILQWTGADENNRLLWLTALLTEPVIAPVRALLAFFGIGEDTPVDVGFFVTSMLLCALRVFLPQLTM